MNLGMLKVSLRRREESPDQSQMIISGVYYLKLYRKL